MEVMLEKELESDILSQFSRKEIFILFPMGTPLVTFNNETYAFFFTINERRKFCFKLFDIKQSPWQTTTFYIRHLNSIIRENNMIFVNNVHLIKFHPNFDYVTFVKMIRDQLIKYHVKKKKIKKKRGIVLLEYKPHRIEEMELKRHDEIEIFHKVSNEFFFGRKKKTSKFQSMEDTPKTLNEDRDEFFKDVMESKKWTHGYIPIRCIEILFDSKDTSNLLVNAVLCGGNICSGSPDSNNNKISSFKTLKDNRVVDIVITPPDISEFSNFVKKKKKNLFQSEKETESQPKLLEEADEGDIVDKIDLLSIEGEKTANKTTVEKSFKQNPSTRKRSVTFKIDEDVIQPRESMDQELVLDTPIADISKIKKADQFFVSQTPVDEEYAQEDHEFSTNDISDDNVKHLSVNPSKLKVERKQVKVILEYHSQNDTELSIQPGEIINVISTPNETWYYGYKFKDQTKTKGKFPIMNCQMIIKDDDNDDDDVKVNRGGSLSPISPQLRESILKNTIKNRGTNIVDVIKEDMEMEGKVIMFDTLDSTPLSPSIVPTFPLNFIGEEKGNAEPDLMDNMDGFMREQTLFDEKFLKMNSNDDPEKFTTPNGDDDERKDGVTVLKESTSTSDDVFPSDLFLVVNSITQELSDKTLLSPKASDNVEGRKTPTRKPPKIPSKDHRLKKEEVKTDNHKNRVLRKHEVKRKYIAKNSLEINLEPGDIIFVLSERKEENMFYGRCDNQVGLFPPEVFEEEEEKEVESTQLDNQELNEIVQDKIEGEIDELIDSLETQILVDIGESDIQEEKEVMDAEKKSKSDLDVRDSVQIEKTYHLDEVRVLEKGRTVDTEIPKSHPDSPKPSIKELTTEKKSKNDLNVRYSIRNDPVRVLRDSNELTKGREEVDDIVAPKKQDTDSPKVRKKKKESEGDQTTQIKITNKDETQDQHFNQSEETRSKDSSDDDEEEEVIQVKRIVKILFSFDSQSPEQMSVNPGDIIEIVDDENIPYQLPESKSGCGATTWSERKQMVYGHCKKRKVSGFFPPGFGVCTTNNSMVLSQKNFDTKNKRKEIGNGNEGNEEKNTPSPSPSPCPSDEEEQFLMTSVPKLLQNILQSYEQIIECEKNGGGGFRTVSTDSQLISSKEAKEEVDETDDYDLETYDPTQKKKKMTKKKIKKKTKIDNAKTIGREIEYNLNILKQMGKGLTKEYESVKKLLEEDTLQEKKEKEQKEKKVMERNNSENRILKKVKESESSCEMFSPMKNRSHRFCRIVQRYENFIDAQQSKRNQYREFERRKRKKIAKQIREEISFVNKMIDAFQKKFKMLFE